MKKFLSLYLLLSLSFIFSSEEEEVRTLNKDGVIYKINNSSLHITPHEEDNTISNVSNEMIGAEKIVANKSNNKEKNTCDTKLDFSFGSQSAFSYDKTNPGTEMGLTLSCPKTINLFQNEFTQAYQLSFASLEGADGGEGMSFVNLYYVLESSLDKFGFLGNLPFTYNFFGGLSDVDAIKDTNSGIHLSLGASVDYKLPTEKCDISLSLSFAQTTNGDNAYGLYTAGLKYGKSLNCSR